MGWVTFCWKLHGLGWVSSRLCMIICSFWQDCVLNNYFNFSSGPYAGLLFKFWYYTKTVLWTITFIFCYIIYIVIANGDKYRVSPCYFFNFQHNIGLNYQRLRLEHPWICALYKFCSNNNNTKRMVFACCRPIGKAVGLGWVGLKKLDPCTSVLVTQM